MSYYKHWLNIKLKTNSFNQLVICDTMWNAEITQLPCYSCEWKKKFIESMTQEVHNKMCPNATRNPHIGR